MENYDKCIEWVTHSWVKLVWEKAAWLKIKIELGLLPISPPRG
jgi:hypothetical protein